MLMLYGSANRDETVFDHPDELDLTREPNPHLAFGIGPHFCLGANLARMEVKIVFQELLQPAARHHGARRASCPAAANRPWCSRSRTCRPPSRRCPVAH